MEVGDGEQLFSVIRDAVETRDSPLIPERYRDIDLPSSIEIRVGRKPLISGKHTRHSYYTQAS